MKERISSAYALILVIYFLGNKSSASIDIEQSPVANEYSGSSNIDKLETQNVDSNLASGQIENVATDFNKTILDDSNNSTTALNASLNESSSTANETKKLVQCRKNIFNETDEENIPEPVVELINGTRLGKLLTPDPEVTSKESEGNCVAVLFFARTCPFSSATAPHFNALARAYPDIKVVALDALKYHGINAQYGIVGVPTLKLFHNGRPVAKFNSTEYTIQAFGKFINTHTGIIQDHLVVMSKDFQGPLPSVIDKQIDYFLVISWLFIIICAVYFFGKSAWWKTIVETVQSNWRESEAQHEHVD